MNDGGMLGFQFFVYAPTHCDQSKQYDQGTRNTERLKQNRGQTDMLAVSNLCRPDPGAPTASRLEDIWPGKQNYVPYTSRGGTRSMISVAVW